MSAWWWGLKGYLKVVLAIFALALLLKLMAVIVHGIDVFLTWTGTGY